MLPVFSRTNHRKKYRTNHSIRFVLAIYCVFGISFFNIRANNSEKTDSLLSILLLESVDSSKATLMIELGLEYLYTDPAKTVEYCMKAKKIFDIQSDLMRYGRASNLMGSAYFAMGESQSAEDCFKEAYTVAKKTNDSLCMAKSLNNLGGVMQKKGNLNQSVEYYIQSLNLYEQTGNTRGAAGVTNNIGAIYRTVGSLDKALFYYDKSVQNAIESDDERTLASVYHNICAIYAEQNKLKEAIEACNLSYSYNQKLNNQSGLIKNFLSFGNINALSNKKNVAREYFLKALTLARSLGFRDDEAAILLHLGNLELEKKNHHKASELFIQGLNIAEEIDNQDLQLELSKYLYTVDSLLGDYKMAIFYLNNYNKLNDQINQFDPDSKIAELMKKYELTRQENFLNEKKIKKDKSIILYLITGTIVLCLISLLIIQQLKFRSRNRISELTQENLRSQMNPHFIFNILNSLHSFILKNDRESSSNYLVKFAKLLRNMLDNSQTRLVTIQDELEALKLYLELESLRHNNKLIYSIDVDEEIDVYMYKIPTLLLQPYVENSIIHGFREIEGVGKLKIEMKLNKNTILCSITDNGIGRKKAMESLSDRPFNHKSYGSKITETRIKLINSIYSNKMSLKFIDLYDDEKKPCGTKVEFNLPVLN